MCGIAGVVDFRHFPVSRHEIEAMNDAMRHRGPDGEGVFLNGAVGLGHRRLAILDPQGGLQPFRSEDDRVVITYNGEVYNFVEIRNELRADFDFRTGSDTEVVLRAYQKWGIDCLEKFQGMFAIGIHFW